MDKETIQKEYGQENEQLYFSVRTQGFYSDAVHAIMPDDVVPINRLQHDQLTEIMFSGCRVLPGLRASEPKPSRLHQWDETTQSWTISAEDEQKLFDEARTQKLALLNARAQSIVNAASGMDVLPEFEVQSWTVQSQEALAWQADPAASTPILDAIAAARSMDAGTLKQKALDKSLAYARVCAGIAGRRQALQTRIEAAQSLADLDEITIDFGTASGIPTEPATEPTEPATEPGEEAGGESDILLFTDNPPDETSGAD